MSQSALSPSYFLLSVFDRQQWCDVLEARFEVADLEQLRILLDAVDNDDPDLSCIYYLDEAEVGAVASAFGINLDVSALDMAEREFTVCRLHPIRSAPYLIHTGYELPLLLDGRKKLARMSDAYPPMAFEGEHRFDHWVAAGILHKEEVIEPFPDGYQHPRSYVGFRTVYYTPKGEEWRIPAMKLVKRAATKSGGWNEYFERLEGMLFGYEDWQNDWWIKTGLAGGGFGGVRLCCAVDDKGLAWMEAAGFRALPPTDQPSLVLHHYDVSAMGADRDVIVTNGSATALAVFIVEGRGFVDLIGSPEAVPWPCHLPAGLVPQLNQLLRRPVIIERR
jgi:hypothetical protein